MKTGSVLFAFSVLIAATIFFLAENTYKPTATEDIEFEIKPSEDKKSNLKAGEYFYGDKQPAPHQNSRNSIPGEQKQPNGKSEISLEDHPGSLGAEQTEIVESEERLSDSQPQATAVENELMRPLDRFNSEPVDFYRAAGMERSYIDLFGSNPLLADYALTQATCKSEYCQISVAVTDKDQAIRLVTALSSSLLGKYGTIDMQIASYGENGLAKFYIRSVSADKTIDKQTDL